MRIVRIASAAVAGTVALASASAQASPQACADRQRHGISFNLADDGGPVSTIQPTGLPYNVTSHMRFHAPRVFDHANCAGKNGTVPAAVLDLTRERFETYNGTMICDLRVENPQHPGQAGWSRTVRAEVEFDLNFLDANYSSRLRIVAGSDVYADLTLSCR